MNKNRSPIFVIVGAVVIGLLVIVLLNSTIRQTEVLVAREALAAGTVLTADLVEVRSVPAGGLPSGAITDIKAIEGQSLTVGRAAGDYITEYVLGEASASGLPALLAPDHVALSVEVKLDSGVAGLLREGQTVTVIGMLNADVIQSAGLPQEALLPMGNLNLENPLGVTSATPTPQPTATPSAPRSPVARIAISGLRVLLVPQSFRYQEVPQGSDSNEQVFTSAMASNSSQNGSVIVLDVPMTEVEIKPGLSVNPAALLAALNEYGQLYLALEPAGGLQLGAGHEFLTLNLGEFYESLNAK